MPDAASLTVRVGSEISGAMGGLATVNARTTSVGRTMGRVMKLGGLAAAAGIGFAIKAAANYETSMNTFQAVSGATGKEMEKVGDLAMDLGRDITLPGTSAKDAADAMTELAKGGLSVRDAMKAAKGVLQLSAAAQIDNAEAAKITARALGAFGLSGSKAGKVADLLAAAANASTAEITDLAAGMQMASAIFKQGGQSIGDLTTALGLMANAGISGSDAGTSLKTMMLRLMAPTKEAAGQIQALGIHLRDAHGNMLPMRELIGQFSEKLGTMTKAQRDAALSTIFGTDAIRAANVILDGGVEKWDKMTTAVNKHGAAQDLAAAKMKGLQGKWEAFKSTLETLAISFGEKLLPVASQVMSSFTGTLDRAGPALTRLGQSIGTLASTGISAFGSLLSAARPAISFLGSSTGVSLIGVVASLYGLARAARTVQSAFTTLRGLRAASLPMVALSGVASLLAAGFVTLAIKTAQARAQMDALKGTVQSLKGTMDPLTQTQAQLNAQMADAAVLTARDNARALHQEYLKLKGTVGPMATQTVTAYHTWRQAVLQTSQAVIDQATRHRELAVAINAPIAQFHKLVDQMVNLRSAPKNAAQAFDSLIGLWQGGKVTVDSFIKNMESLRQKTLAVSTANSAAHPTFARMMAALSDTALAAAIYAKEQGKIPSKRDIQLTLKAYGLKDTADGLLKIPRVAGKVASETPKMFGAAAGPMRSAGAKLSSSAAAGVAAGAPKIASTISKGVASAIAAGRGAAAGASSVGAAIASGVVAGASGFGSRLAANMISEINAAIAAAKSKLQAASPSRLTAAEIGKPIGQGIIVGFSESIANFPGKVRSDVGAAISSAHGLSTVWYSVGNAMGAALRRGFKAGMTPWPGTPGPDRVYGTSNDTGYETASERQARLDREAHDRARLDKDIADARARVAAAEAATVGEEGAYRTQAEKDQAIADAKDSLAEALYNLSQYILAIQAAIERQGRRPINEPVPFTPFGSGGLDLNRGGVPNIIVNVNVEGNIATEDQFADRLAPKLTPAIIRELRRAELRNINVLATV